MNIEDDLPFSLPVNVRTLPAKGRIETYTAKQDVCANIAAAYDLVSIEHFKAEATLTPWKRDGVKASGWVKADYKQPCAALGEPLEQHMDEAFDLVFLPEGSRLIRPPGNDDGELVFDPLADDLPDTFSGDSIDLATVWLEFFALGLDPFARAEGVDFNAADTSDEAASGRDSPFAVLESLKKH